MPLTLSQAQSWRPETVQAVAVEFKAKLKTLGETLDAAKTATNKAAAFSAGDGELARFDFVDRATAYGWRKHAQMTQLLEAVDQAGYALIAAHGRLAVAVEAAVRAGLKVWNDGSVTGYEPAVVEKHAEAVGRSLHELDQADQDYAHKINDFAALIKDSGVYREADFKTFGGAYDMPLHPKQSPEPPSKYKISDLYGPDGRPHGSDVKQDDLGDCYWSADMMAVADHSPRRIMDHIRADPQTGDFIVTLWSKDAGKWIDVRVTAEDIDTDIRLNGASWRDNRMPNSPLWPAVMECGFAKMRDVDENVSMETKLKGIEGWYAEYGMSALTGNYGHNIGNGVVDPSADELFNGVKNAMANNQPATLSTLASGFNYLPWHHQDRDGLVDGHVYEVVGAVEVNGEKYIQLRNPWENNDFKEDLSPGPLGYENSKGAPMVTVKVQDILSDGGFGYVNIGDAGQ